MLYTFRTAGDQQIPEPWHLAFFYGSWLLDSLFNDACVVFVGLGPADEAFTAIGQAGRAEAVLLVQWTVRPDDYWSRRIDQ